MAATSTTEHLSAPNRPTFACIRCADRKVKCDRQRPCSACVKHNVECVFNPVPPPKKRQKRVNTQILASRLKYYEALLQEKGVDPGKLPDPPHLEQHQKPSPTRPDGSNDAQLQTPSSLDSPPNLAINKTQVVHGQGRSQFVDNSLWTRVVEEVSNFT